MKILALAALLAAASALHAEPRLIHPTDFALIPTTRPLIHPTSFPLIPTTRPLILPGAPTINPQARLVVPTEFPLVPSGTSSAARN